MGRHPNPVYVLQLLLIVNTITSPGFFASAQMELCSNGGFFAKNDTYESNLKRVLGSVPSNVTSGAGFYSATAGSGDNEVYLIAQCRGDVGARECLDCANATARAAKDTCRNQKEAVLRGDVCMVRYANRNISGRLESEPSMEVPNPNQLTDDPSAHNATLHGLLTGLVERASTGSGAKFASGSSGTSPSLYGLVQCTPDISTGECRACLRGALDKVSGCCGGTEGGRVLRPSCLVWFEVFKFYESRGTTFDVSLSPPPSADTDDLSPPTSIGKKRSVSPIVLKVVIAIVVLVTVLAMACAIFLYRRAKKGVHDNNDAVKSLESLKFDLSVIKEATDDFSDEHKLGQGGFGSVYKGKLRSGQEIAVKRLSEHSSQGEEEFVNEIALVAKLQHRNLVTLLGFCSEAKERILVYEFVGNGSLDRFLFDPEKRDGLNWEKRFRIICGIGRGLIYLHEDSRLKVVHRDLKASNVLLDENMNPRVADFGLARLFVPDQSEANTRRNVGTYGYMAPEYALHGQFSAKSDVFSFGVLVLEIVSAKRNSWWDSGEDLVHLLSYTWKNWREGNVVNVVDLTLGNGLSSEVTRCVHVALLCVQERADLRPTMASAVMMLTSHSATLPLPAQPAFYMYATGLLPGSDTTDTSESTQSTSHLLVV